MAEITTLKNPSNTAFYWNLLKNTSDEVKIHLITLLSQSLSKEKTNAHKISEKKRTEAFLNEFFGAWKGDESFAEIMSAIRANRSIRKPPAFD